MAIMLEKKPPWGNLLSSGTCKRKFENDVEMSSLKKRRPNAKSYTVDIYEQPRSMEVSFLNEHEKLTSSSYIVGERSKAQVQTDPSLLLSNFRGTVKIIWYLVADDVRYPHPYTLEGDDCVEGVCTKTIKAKGEVVSFPGLSIRKVSWKVMEQVLSNRVDRLKQLVPEMEFRMKSLRDYDLRSVKICFQALPQDAVHDYSVILKPVLTRHIHTKDPFPLRDPRIMSISECKGTVHGKTEVTLLVSNLKTDDVLVFFYYASLHPRISWQAFADIITITQTKQRQALILIDTPPFHNRSITEPNTVNVEIRLRDNSCSNTVKYTYTPTTQVVNRIQRRVKQKEPIFANYFSCLGAVTNVPPLVPTRELHQDDDKSTSDWDETPKTIGFDIKPRKQKPKTPARKDDNNLWKSTSLSLPAGQSLQERKLGGFNSKEEIGEADGRVDPDQLSRYLSLTNLNNPKESIPNGLPSHECYREEPDKVLMAASGASSCKTITEENIYDFKRHSPSRENSPLLRAEGCHAQGTGVCKEENTAKVPYKDNYMLNTVKEPGHTTTIPPPSSEIFSEHDEDLSQVPSHSESGILLSRLSSHYIHTFCDQGEETKPIGKVVWEPNTDSGFPVVGSCISDLVVPASISEQSDSSIYKESTPTDSLEKKSCTSHAGKDGKSTPTCQTPSPEAFNSTDDQQGAESNQNFGRSQHENESASKDGNREGDRHDHDDNDEVEDDTFREELRPPRATQRIDHRGGTISLTKCDIFLTIPPGALAEGQEEEIVLSVDWNDRHIPPLNSTDMNVAPIVNCYPTGLTFLKLVTLKIPHCAILPDPEKCKATVHWSQTDEGKAPNWKKLSQGGISDVRVECAGRYFHLQTNHFTSFIVTLNNNETSLAKEIMFVPYGKIRYSDLDNREIRLYLYDNHASNSEKIYQEEQRYGGKMLDTSNSYHIVELHKGSIDVEMHTNMVGWLLKSDNKFSFLFRKVWNQRSWTKCKFTFKNLSQNREFNCIIIAEQQGSEEDSLKMEICNDAQNPPENLGIQSKDLLMQSKNPEQITSTQQALYVAVGPGSIPLSKQLSMDNASLDSGIPHLSHHFHFHQHADSMSTRATYDGSEPIIPPSLSRKLCELLDLRSPVHNDWKRLAEECQYDQYIRIWKDKQDNNNQANYSPTEVLLILLEQEKKISNLAELEGLMKQINRLDAVEAVAKVREQRDQPNPSSSTLPALTGGQEEQPMSTDTTPSPKDINQPLSGGGQPRYDFQPVQSGSCPTPKRPYADCTHDDDSTPSTNNNHQSNATCKKLDFDYPVEELQHGLEACNLSNKAFRSRYDNSN